MKKIGQKFFFFFSFSFSIYAIFGSAFAVDGRVEQQQQFRFGHTCKHTHSIHCHFLAFHLHALHHEIVRFCAHRFLFGRWWCFSCFCSVSIGQRNVAVIVIIIVVIIVRLVRAFAIACAPALPWPSSSWAPLPSLSATTSSAADGFPLSSSSGSDTQQNLEAYPPTCACNRWRLHHRSSSFGHRAHSCTRAPFGGS
jgi:hypothetical protein